MSNPTSKNSKKPNSSGGRDDELVTTVLRDHVASPPADSVDARYNSVGLTDTPPLSSSLPRYGALCGRDGEKIRRCLLHKCAALPNLPEGLRLDDEFDDCLLFI